MAAFPPVCIASVLFLLFCWQRQAETHRNVTEISWAQCVACMQGQVGCQQPCQAGAVTGAGPKSATCSWSQHDQRCTSKLQQVGTSSSHRAPGPSEAQLQAHPLTGTCGAPVLPRAPHTPAWRSTSAGRSPGRPGCCRLHTIKRDRQQHPTHKHAGKKGSEEGALGCSGDAHEAS